MFYEERCIDGRWEYRTTPTGEWRPGRWQEPMTAPDSRDSVARVVAEIERVAHTLPLDRMTPLLKKWATRLQALARGPQQAGGEDDLVALSGDQDKKEIDNLGGHSFRDYPND